jgi:hypothetical protein
LLPVAYWVCGWNSWFFNVQSRNVYNESVSASCLRLPKSLIRYTLEITRKI